jgi:hypothetical protein
MTPEEVAAVEKLIRERNEKLGGTYDEATGMWSFPPKPPSAESDKSK